MPSSTKVQSQTNLDDIDQLYDEAIQVKSPRKAHRRTSGPKQIKVRGSIDIARDAYKKAKKVHRAEISRLKANIRSHKLLIKQARTTFGLIKLQEK